MKAGDLVMFNNVGSKYAKHFYGQFAIVESCSSIPKGSLATQYCRVTWLQPIKYFGRTATYSDFKASDFEVYDEGR